MRSGPLPSAPGAASTPPLAMVASVEAIFLSTFVLITQNRMAAAADRRADLDLQISLLTEHELTKLATLLTDMAILAKTVPVVLTSRGAS